MSLNSITYKSTIRKVLFFIVLLTLLVAPLLYKSYNHQNNQIFTYCIFASLFGFTTIWHLSKNTDSKISLTKIDIVIFIFLTYTFFHQRFFSHSFDWLISNRALSILIVYISSKNFSKSKTDINFLFNLLLIFGLIESIIVLAEIFQIFSFFPNSVYRINGTFKNPNVVSIFLALLIPISLYCYHISNRTKPLYLIFTLLFITVILFSKCRSAIIIMIMLSLFFILKYFKTIKTKYLISISIITIILVIFLGIFWHSKKESNSSRKLIWSISWDMIKENPIKGYGMSSFEKEYNLYQAKLLKSKSVDYLKQYQTGYIRQPYNEYLYFWITGGILSLALFLIIFFIVTSYLKKSITHNKDKLLLTSTISLISLFIVSSFSYTLYVPAIEILFFIHLGILSNFSKSIFDKKIKKNFIISTFSFLIFVVFVYSCKNLHSDYQISKCIKSLPANKQISIFENNFRLNKTNPVFLYFYSLALMKQHQFDEALEKLEFAKTYSSYYEIYCVAGICYDRLKLVNEAEQNIMTSTYLCPKMFRPKYLLLKHYLKENNTDKAKQIAYEITKMPITVHSPEVNKIIMEAKKILKNP